MKRPFGLAAVGVLLAGCQYYRPVGDADSGVLPDARIAEAQKFQSIASAFIDWNYAVHPGWATSDGVHDYDGQLGRWTREAIDARLNSLSRYQQRLLSVDPAEFDANSAYDYEVLMQHISAAKLDLSEVRSWESNPNFYRDIISHGVYTLASLQFDSAERRMNLATERLKQVPDVLAAARDNLAHPPKIFTEIAIDEFDGTHAFIKTGLLQAFAEVKDETIRVRFADAQKHALEAIEKFIDWLRKDLLPQSTGSFALGSDLYRKKVALDEGVDLPVDELLQHGYDLLRAAQAELKTVAGDKPVKQLLRETSKDHPKPEALVAETQAMLQGLKTWAADYATFPADAECKVQETPVFRRSLSFASMETPGPFEKVARDAYYSVTPVEPTWTAEQQEQHLSFFNRNALTLVSVHEAYPGHYVQFLALQNCPSKVRKVFGCASFSEGWAHYCEQLYAEAHPGDSALKVRQLQLALVRICRYIAGIELHTKGKTVEQAAELFMNEAYMERAGAEREARRGTSDPTYLVYTLGKHEILKLRDEYRARKGGDLKAFHDALLSTGYPPLPIARKILFGVR